MDRGPFGLFVELKAWGPQPWQTLKETLYDESQANWGEHPSHARHETWTDRHEATVENLFAGGSLPQPLELISFAFEIDGCSRATTHQLVRTRIGAGFMQHGGRDNDWRHRGWTMPETIARANDANFNYDGDADPRTCCITDWEPLIQYMKSAGFEMGDTLRDAISLHLHRGKQLYSALVDAGIPWQDARRLLPMGTQTFICANYTYPALSGVLANRLEHVMDWEINCVAQLMLREIKMKCPKMMSRHLGSHSDKAKAAKFAGLESWPPDGKWPDPGRRHQDLPRTHYATQNPFWVLAPESLEGEPIRWIETNGTYPDEARGDV
jgi:thymidylate synthase ThyX